MDPPGRLHEDNRVQQRLRQENEILTLQRRLSEQRSRARFLKNKLRMTTRETNHRNQSALHQNKARSKSECYQAIDDIGSAFSLWNDDYSKEKSKIKLERAIQEMNRISLVSAGAASNILKAFKDYGEVNYSLRNLRRILIQALEIVDHFEPYDEYEARIIHKTRQFLYFANTSRNFLSVSKKCGKITTCDHKPFTKQQAKR